MFFQKAGIQKAGKELLALAIINTAWQLMQMKVD